MSKIVNKSGIYAIYNRENCHLYIGSSIHMRSRWYEHKYMLRRDDHHSVYLQRAWNKHGESAFEFDIIEECSPEHLLERERFWIEELAPEYNAMPIDMDRQGFTHSEESRSKIGAASKARGAKPPSRNGIKLTPEQIAQREETKRLRKESGVVYNYSNGKVPQSKLPKERHPRQHSTETRAKMSESAKQRGNPPDRERTQEERDKTSATLKQHYSNPENRERLRRQATGKIQSEESKAKRSASIKAWWAARKVA